MPTHISVRVLPKNERTIVASSVVLFEGEADGNDEVCDTLFEGDIVTKSAKFTRVDRSQRSHDKLQIQSKYSTKRPNQSVLLRDEDDEASLTKLSDLIVAARHVDRPGDYVVLNVSDTDSDGIDAVISALFIDTDRLNLLPTAMRISENKELISQLDTLVSDYPDKARILADGMNLARRANELQEFRELVAEERNEPEYQRFLMDHTWIFGSEYNRMYPRYIVKGKEFDFPMQRTADGYLEIIEIKRPDHRLFTWEKNQNTGELEIVGISPVVAKAIYQTDGYLSLVEKHVNDIQVEENITAEKVRGKVIIGNANDNSDVIRTVRQLNARMNKIEVITYDQLIANAQRMLSIMREESEFGDDGENPDDEYNSSAEDDSGWSDDDNSDGSDRPASVDDIPF